MKKIFVIVSIFIFLMSSCKRTEEQPVPQMEKGPIIEATGDIPAHEGMGISTTKFQIVVPEDVKESWSGVRLILNDKELNRETELTIGIGEELRIPETNLNIKVGYFLPDFKMSGDIITSASNKPDNPSAGVIIYEKGKKIFPQKGEWGWLYVKFPSVHPFMHERYELFLKEGIRME